MVVDNTGAFARTVSEMSGNLPSVHLTVGGRQPCKLLENNVHCGSDRIQTLKIWYGCSHKALFVVKIMTLLSVPHLHLFRHRRILKLDITLRIINPTAIFSQIFLCNGFFRGARVPVAFAICFFIFIALSETLRHGVFGLSPSEISAISYVALALCALLILRADVLFTFRRPRHALYGAPGMNWTWTRTLMGLVLGPLLWIIPVAYGVTLIQINIGSVSVQSVVQSLFYQVVLVALAGELFFREAAVKSFQGNLPAMAIASTLAYFVFHVPDGYPLALIAAGSGLYFLTLRLIGTNIFAVAVLHGATVVVLTQIIPLGLSGAELWRYAIYFTVASAALSLTVFSLFNANQRKLQHA